VAKQILSSKANVRKSKKLEGANRDLEKQLDEFKTKLEQSNSVKNDLKKQLESKERMLRSNNEKKKQLQTTLEGLTKLVDILNQTVKDLCEHPKDVSTCSVEDVTVRSLKYLRVSVTSKFDQTAKFQRSVPPLSLGPMSRDQLMTQHICTLFYSCLC